MTYRLTPMHSWAEFIATAERPHTISYGAGRKVRDAWPGATWEEALRLAREGWVTALPEVTVGLAGLRGHSTRLTTTALLPTWDVTGAEVDVGVYLAGVPECMVDAVPQRISAHGRVVTLLVPASYASRTPHAAIMNRGVALAALCSALITAGHSAEIWSVNAGWANGVRHAGAAKVLAAGEPLDLGRLIFAVAHPAMLRRLWCAVWDGEPEPVARRVHGSLYFRPCAGEPEDLPVTGPVHVLPYLDHRDRQWESPESALAWCERTFAELGLAADVGP